MTTEILGMELGSWADTIAAVGGLVAAAVSVLALRTALAANATAERTRAEAKDFADLSRSRDELRQRAEVARQLQAWWVVWGPEGAKRFGVLVTNAGEGATVFRNVRIETRGNANATGDRGHIAMTSLPPGTYVFESKARGAEQAWGDPAIADSATLYQPLVRAHKYAVDRILFQDPMNFAWCWSPESGLTEASVEGEADAFPVDVAAFGR